MITEMGRAVAIAQRAVEASAIDVDHGVGHGGHFLPGRLMFPTRDGRLGSTDRGR